MEPAVGLLEKHPVKRPKPAPQAASPLTAESLLKNLVRRELDPIRGEIQEWMVKTGQAVLASIEEMEKRLHTAIGEMEKGLRADAVSYEETVKRYHGLLKGLKTVCEEMPPEMRDAIQTAIDRAVARVEGCNLERQKRTEQQIWQVQQAVERLNKAVAERLTEQRRQHLPGTHVMIDCPVCGQESYLNKGVLEEKLKVCAEKLKA